MGDGDIGVPRRPQGRGKPAQEKGKPSDAGRHCSDQVDAWNWRDRCSYSDELQTIITLITGGYPPGRAKEEDGHADQ